MVTRLRPAVLACPTPRVRGEKSVKCAHSPYPAWPEIKPSTFYVLPTLYSSPNIAYAWYQPKISSIYSETATVDELWLPSTIDEVLELFNSVSRGVAETTRMRGSDDPAWDAFAVFHESGHCVSWLIGRYATTEAISLASEIFDLLTPGTVEGCTSVWDEFQRLNGALVEHLDKALALEELRATLFAFMSLDPDTRATVESDVRNVMLQQGITHLLDEFSTLTDEDLAEAWWMTILAEIVDAEDPILVLRDKKLFSGLQDLLLALLPRLIREGAKTGYKVTLIGSTDGRVEIREMENRALSPVVWETVFLESLRQQLAQWSGLICPFRKGRSSCCGFGAFLQYIWKQIPPEYRYPKFVIDQQTGKKIFFRVPSKVCLNCKWSGVIKMV